jgi:hypothetical protein
MTSAEGGSVEMRWIRLGIAAGLGASVAYPLLLVVPSPLVTVVLGALLGPLIGAASLGLCELLRLHERSVAAVLGAISNIVAGALFCAMALVQLAVRQGTDPATGLVGVWLGLDVAWDVYIGLGTIAFAVAMLRHPRFGWWFAGSGLALGLLELVLNLGTFPTPPAEAELLDIGPFVGLWYLAATLRAWGSLGWARERLGAGS